MSEKPRYISDKEKEDIINHYSNKAADGFRREFSKFGPKGSTERGVGFTRAPSDGPPNPGEHPVEFRPGASNVEAIDKDEEKI